MEPAMLFTVSEKYTEIADGVLTASEVAQLKNECGMGLIFCLIPLGAGYGPNQLTNYIILSDKLLLSSPCDPEKLFHESLTYWALSFHR